ncbi:MAG: phage major capsid protein [Casimicrobiaceae bacterium]
MSDYTTRPISALPKGVAFARAALALMVAQGDTRKAAGFADSRWRDSPATVTYLKSAVVSGSTIDSEWGGPLAEYDHASAEFSELLRNGSILGKLTGARRVPFGVRYPQQTAASSVAWVGQSAPAPVSELAFQTATIGFAKVSGIVAFSNELVESASPDVEGLVKNDLLKSAIEFLDAQFVNPGVTAVINVSPGSITSGITAVQSTGSTATQIAADLAALATQLADANETDSLYWIMSRSDAVRLAAKRGTDGSSAFPGVTATGGILLGIPIIASNAVPHTVSAGSVVVLVNASGIDYADNNLLQLSISAEASLQMNSTPDAGAQALVSLFQINAAAVRLTKLANWQRRRATAVAVLDNAHW